MEEAAKLLLGDPPIVKSRDPQLWSYLAQKLDDGVSTIVAVKHSQVVTSLVVSPTTSSATISHWLRMNRMPISDELTSENFQTIMRSDDGPYVVLAALDTDKRTQNELEMDTSKLYDMAKKWHQSGRTVNGRPVVFMWMDGKMWAKWLKTMYGIKGVSVTSSVPSLPVAD